MALRIGDILIPGIAIATGETIKPVEVEPYEFDYLPGYINNGTWTYQNSTNNRTDFFNVTINHVYILSLGDIVGSRFRSAIYATNPVGRTSNVSANTQLSNINSPTSYSFIAFKSEINGFLGCTKDNASLSGVPLYLFDITDYYIKIKDEYIV